MGSTWVLLAPDGPHVGPMNLVIRVLTQTECGLVDRKIGLTASVEQRDIGAPGSKLNSIQERQNW